MNCFFVGKLAHQSIPTIVVFENTALPTGWTEVGLDQPDMAQKFATVAGWGDFSDVTLVSEDPTLSLKINRATKWPQMALPQTEM